MHYFVTKVHCNSNNNDTNIDTYSYIGPNDSAIPSTYVAKFGLKFLRANDCFVDYNLSSNTLCL